MAQTQQTDFLAPGAPRILNPSGNSNRGRNYRGRGDGRGSWRARGNARGGAGMNHHDTNFDRASMGQQRSIQDSNRQSPIITRSQNQQQQRAQSNQPSTSTSTSNHPTPSPSTSTPTPNIDSRTAPPTNGFRTEEEARARQLEEWNQRVRQKKLDLHQSLHQDNDRFREKCQGWIGNVREIICDLDFDCDKADVLHVALGRQIRHLWESARPSKRDLANRQSIIDRLQKLISQKWPGQGLQISAFGSSLTGLSTATSDLDLVLLDPSHPGGCGTPEDQVQYKQIHEIRFKDDRPSWESVHVLGRLISSPKGQSFGFTDVEKIAFASTPIVKFVDQSTGIQVDLNCNDRFGTANSKLISAYSDIRKSLVRPLMYFIKYWSKCRNLNDPSGRNGSASFSSYSLCLMVIHYLQQEQQLPFLQSQGSLERCGISEANQNMEYAYLRPQRRRFVRDREREERERNSKSSTKCDTSFPTNVQEFDEYTELEIEGQEGEVHRDKALGKAVVGFFEYFSKFQRDKLGVSILYKRLDLKPNKKDLDDQWKNLSEMRIGSDPSSVHAGDLQPKSLPAYEKKEFPPKEWSNVSWVVQDPMILNRNTSRALREVVSDRFERELKKALDGFYEGKTLADVCMDHRLDVNDQTLEDNHD